tara:strand:- start:23766 stop:24800 length:1035 start_codon:yes stop_codon:yes gene_type:complete
MNFTDLQKMFEQGDLTEDVLLEENVAPGDFIKMREDTQGFETWGTAEKPKAVRDRVYRYVFVTESPIGSFKDVPLANGWDLKQFRARNSPILFGHDSDSAPVGRGLTVQRNRDYEGLKAMLGQVEFAPQGLSDQADLVESMVGAGFLNCGSVGFNIKKMREPTKEEAKKWGLGKFSAIFEQMDLVEYSVVSLGRDPRAGVIYTDEGRASFDGWLAENAERFTEESVACVRETILKTPSTKSFHALRTWLAKGEEGAVEPATGGPAAVALGNVGVFDAVTHVWNATDKAARDRITKLEEQVQQLTERLDSDDAGDGDDDGDETVFGLSLERLTEILEAGRSPEDN